MLTLVVLLSSITFVILIALLIFRVKSRHMLQASQNIPGPKPLPIIGNVLDVGFNPEEVLHVVCRLLSQYPPVTRVWLGPILFIGVTEAKHLEAVMGSTAHIQKAFFYKNLTPWLGTGLLTSRESTMGVSVKAQTDGSADYVRSISRMGNIAVERALKPWLFIDKIFALSALKRGQNKCLAVLHDMTNSVIRKRKQELLAELGTQYVERSKKDEFGRKRHMNFLDLLLQTPQDGDHLTDEEIREEVDTFMFEGHDTTASGCLFTLWCLAKHQHVQDKAVAELKEIFGDSDREATFSDLNKMKYLEQVIKESLRLYPTVPLFGRELTEDVVVDDYVFPAGANIVFVPHSTHRNPKYFPDPEKFDPDRFLPENCKGRHPYSYIPFAAGPRNCIGQKFAMLELKSLLSKVLMNYKLCLGHPEEQLKLVAELVLRSQNGIRLKLERRK